MQIELTVDKNGNIVIIRKNTTTMTLVSTELITQSSNDLEN